MSLHEKTIADLKELYQKKEITPTDVVTSFLDRIKATNNELQSFSYINEEEALKQAAELDPANADHKDKPLWGIPIAVKDNMCIEGHPATCGSKILENFVSPYDGAMSEKLTKAGAIILGSCNMDEFAMGSSCENNPFYKTKNPWDLERVPGGSSGGSAASVAAMQVPASLGSDTGGSIRQPSSFCGVVGLKPTYGRVSRYGLVAYASSLDQIGPITRDAKDQALLLNAIAGHDERDSTSLKADVPDYTSFLTNGLQGLKIGIPKEYFTEGLHKGTATEIEKSIEVLKSLGAEVVNVSLPNTEYAIAAYYILATAEASANLARFDGIRYGHRSQNVSSLDDVYINSRTEGFGPEVKRRIILGTFVLSSGYYDAYYRKAQQVRTIIRKDFENAFNKADIILTPTSPFTAFKAGEKVSDPISMYLSDICTVSVNLAGLPAISVPCGFDENGLPVGMQFIAPFLEEGTLLKTTYNFQNEAGIVNKNLKV